MGLAEDILDNLHGFTKAMYSTWFFYRPARILLDSGEGVSTTMENFSFAIEQVFLTHGHYDHIGGLPGLIQARNSARGDKEKPLKVFFPEGDFLVRALRDYIARVSSRMSYDLGWQELSEGEDVPLRVGGKDAFVRAFRTQHCRSSDTLGYAIMERRTRLRPGFVGQPEETLRDLVLRHGRDHVMETYEKKLLVYGGDSLALDVEAARDAEVLVHDSTFLSSEDREEPTHATSEEAIRLARDAGVRILLLQHVSSRYSHDRVMQVVSSQVQSLAPDLHVRIASGRSILPLERRSRVRSDARS